MGTKGAVLREEPKFCFPQRIMVCDAEYKTMKLVPMEWGFMGIRKTDHFMTYSYLYFSKKRNK